MTDEYNYVQKYSEVFSLKVSCPPIDSIMRLMTVWRITGKIIRTPITVTYAQL